MIKKETIEEITKQHLIDNDLILVEIKINKANNIKVFFNASGRGTTLDDCIKLSKLIEGGLDRDKEDFSLTVSSAGNDKNN